MAHITGLSRNVAAVPVSNTNGTAAPPTPAAPNTPTIIDGTPVRVAALMVGAAVGLGALHAAGFRFTIGVN